MHIKSTSFRSKNGRKTSLRRPKSTFSGIFECPNQNTSCVFYHLDTQKVDFFTLLHRKPSSLPEGPLGGLKNGQKHVCRPSNAVGHLYFAGSSVWNSNLMSTSPSQSSGNVEKNRKMQKSRFLAIFLHKPEKRPFLTLNPHSTPPTQHRKGR